MRTVSASLVAIFTLALTSCGPSSDAYNQTGGSAEPAAAPLIVQAPPQEPTRVERPAPPTPPTSPKPTPTSPIASATPVSTPTPPATIPSPEAASTTTPEPYRMITVTDPVTGERRLVRVFTGASTSTGSSTRKPAPEPEVYEDYDAVLALAGFTNDIVVGGNGRYLLIVMRTLQKVGVFDLREAKVKKYVNVDGTNFLVAAGATRFVVVDSDNRTLTRWNYDKLDAFEARNTYADDERTPQHAVMGMNGEGPLLLKLTRSGVENPMPLEFFDLETLSSLNTKLQIKPTPKANGTLASRFKMAALPDGKHFILITDNSLPWASVSFTPTDVKVDINREFTSSSTGDRAVSFDGSYEMTSRGPFINRDTVISELKPFFGSGAADVSLCLPPHYWLASSGFGSSGSGPGSSGEIRHQVGFQLGTNTKPLVVLKLRATRDSFPPPQFKSEGNPASRFMQLFYNATEKTLVRIVPSLGVIFVKRFDLDDAVAKLDRPVQYIPPTPEVEFIPGQKFEQVVQVVSNQPNVTFRIEAGPDGMTVSPTGKVEWTPGENTSATQTAIIAVSDASGKQLFHTLRMTRGYVPIKETVVGVDSAPVDPNEPRVAVRLPAAFDDVVVGASGRYLLATMKSLRQIAVIDVKERRILKIIPADSDDVKIAAGATRFVIFSSKGTLSRWNFSRLDRETTIPFTTPVESMCMGASSEGPILVSMQDGVRETAVLLELSTLRPSKIKIQESTYGVREYVAAAANGQTFTSWRKASTPTGLHTLVIRGDEALSHYEHLSAGPTTPSPDGSLIYTMRGTYSTEGKPLEEQTNSYQRGKLFAKRIPFPAATGTFYLSVPSFETRKNVQSTENPEVTFHVQGSRATLLTIPGLMQPTMPERLDTSDPLLSRRLLYVPIADAVVSMGTAADTIYLQRFVLDEALGKLTEPYLFVTSAPPAAVRPSSRLSYQVETRSKAGSVKYRLDSAPTGAQISPEGLLTWNIAGTVEGVQTFVVHVSDAANIESFHTFNIDVNKSAPAMTGRPTTAVATAAGTSPTENTAVAGPTTPVEVVDVGRPKTEIVLPGPLDQACVGGGGKYLLCVIPSLRQVAVVDVRAKKLLKLVPVDDDDVRIAAGATHFVVSLGTKGVLSRYKLATAERELTTAAPAKRIQSITMGCGSEGPIIAFGEAGASLIDLQTLKPSTISMPPNQRFNMSRDVATSADGRFFTTGEGQYTIWDKTVTAFGQEHFRGGGGFGLPSSDGRVVYTHAGMWAAGGSRIGGNDQNQNQVSYNIPAAVGPLYIQFKPTDDPRRPPMNPTLHIQGESQPILSLDEIESPNFTHNNEGRSLVKLWSERCFLLPNDEAIVTAPRLNDRFIVHRFNLSDELKRTDIDYLFALSVAPAAIPPRTKLQYQLDVRSKRGGVKYRLEAGPTGMTVSPTGLIAWQAAAAEPEEQVVIVAISDASGQELFHTFKFKVDANAPVPVVAAGPTDVEPVTTTVTTEPAPPAVAVEPAAPAVAPEPAEPGERQKHIIKLPAAMDNLSVGGGGRYLVAQMKSLRQVAIVDAVEKRVVKYLPVDDDKTLIAAGATKLVVGLASKNILMRYDLATGNREISVAFSGKSIDSMAMGAASEGPLFIGQNSHYDLSPTFYDVRTLKPLAMNFQANRGMRFGTNVRVSADGRLFGSWSNGISPTGVHLVTVNGASAEYHNDHTSAGMILPSPDSRFAYTSLGIYTPDAKRLDAQGRTGSDYDVMLPASSGPLYLKLSLPGFMSQRQDDAAKLTVHMQGETLPILTAEGVVLPDVPRDVHPAHVSQLGLDKRLLLLPIADALVTVLTAADQLIIQRFNLDEELAKSEIDFLFAASSPPASIAAGATLNYQIAAKSKRGGVKYRLDSAPAGMTVSPTGLVSWKAVKGQESEQVVIVSLSDASGQETFHTFKLRIDSPSGASSTPTPKPTGTATGAAQPPIAVPTATAPIPKPTATGTSVAAAASNLRTWTSSDGQFKIEAEYVKYADQKVTLRRADGTTIDVPLDKLSAVDQEQVRKMIVAPKPK